MALPVTPPPLFVFPYLFSFVFSACAAAGAVPCAFSHGRRVVQSFEIKAHVRQSRVSPCVHVNPWFCEPFRHECWDNHLLCDLSPASQQALCMMWQPTSCSFARSPPMRHFCACCPCSSSWARHLVPAVPSDFCRRSLGGPSALSH